MSLIGAVAKRYARAFFEAARAAGDLERAGEEIDAFRRVVAGHAGLKRTIENPTYPARLRKGIVDEIAREAGLSDRTRAFLCLLVDKGRIRMLATVGEAFHALADESAGRARATVTTARPVSPREAEELRAKLEALTGKRILAEMRVDPEILGGVLARIGGLVVDGSVRRRLEGVRANLLGAGT